MAIEPEAIQRFLKRVHADPPSVKGADPDELRRMIYNCTGAFYQEVTVSRKHQLEGVAFALYLRNALLLYHMRLGKTKIGLDWAAQLKRANLVHRKGLILAHAPVGAEVWEGEIARHSQLTGRTIMAGPDSSDRFVDALMSDCDLIIMPLSMAQHLFTMTRLNRKEESKWYPDAEKLHLAAEFFDHAIIDETHFYADHTRLPFQVAAGLTAQCPKVLGLTGTPVGRDPYAIWAQAYLVDKGVTFGRSYYFFEIAFGKKVANHFVKSGQKLVFDKTKLPFFQYKLDSIALTYGKHEVASAEVLTGLVELEMTVEQKREYNRVVDSLISLRHDATVEIEETFSRLRRIASGYLPFRDDEGQARVLHFDHAPKMLWMTEFLSEVPADIQCVIFHEFIHSGELLEELLTKYKIPFASIRGNIPGRAAELARFQSGKARFLIANTRTGGTAIELGMADYLCFFESPVGPITRAQAMARPMGRPVDRALFLDDLICSPVERRILGFIAEGENLLASLMRGGVRRLREELRA